MSYNPQQVESREQSPCTKSTHLRQSDYLLKLLEAGFRPGRLFSPLSLADLPTPAKAGLAKAEAP
jgi:hypothetical protein